MRCYQASIQVTRLPTGGGHAYIGAVRNFLLHRAIEQ